MATQNYASVFSPKVDERFYKESQAAMALNNDYKFTGVKTINVYSIPTVAMGNYTRTGANRYGTPTDLGTNAQALTITKDRAWTCIIDKMDKNQQQMVLDAGKAVSRQLREVIVPEYDTYVFKTLAQSAIDHGNYASTALDKSNAYAAFLAGMERLGDKNVPKHYWVAAQ